MNEALLLKKYRGMCLFFLSFLPPCLSSHMAWAFFFVFLPPCLSSHMVWAFFFVFPSSIGIRFYDTDDSLVYEIESSNLEWKKRDKKDMRTPCYVILAKAVRRADSDGEDSEDECEEDHVAYHINSELHSMISDSRSEHPSNLQLRSADQSIGST